MSSPMNYVETPIDRPNGRNFDEDLQYNLFRLFNKTLESDYISNIEADKKLTNVLSARHIIEIEIRAEGYSNDTYWIYDDFEIPIKERKDHDKLSIDNVIMVEAIRAAKEYFSGLAEEDAATILTGTFVIPRNENRMETEFGFFSLNDRQVLHDSTIRVKQTIPHWRIMGDNVHHYVRSKVMLKLLALVPGNSPCSSWAKGSLKTSCLQGQCEKKHTLTNVPDRKEENIWMTKMKLQKTSNLLEGEVYDKVRRDKLMKLRHPSTDKKRRETTHQVAYLADDEFAILQGAQYNNILNTMKSVSREIVQTHALQAVELDDTVAEAEVFRKVALKKMVERDDELVSMTMDYESLKAVASTLKREIENFRARFKRARDMNAPTGDIRDKEMEELARQASNLDELMKERSAQYKKEDEQRRKKVKLENEHLYPSIVRTETTPHSSEFEKPPSAPPDPLKIKIISEMEENSGIDEDMLAMPPPMLITKSQSEPTSHAIEVILADMKKRRNAVQYERK